MKRKFGLAEPIASKVWFDSRSKFISVEIDGIVSSIDFEQIPEDDFESLLPIIKVDLGNEGTVVVCHHRDGVETWLPVDMWLPDGFTPLTQDYFSNANRY